MKVAPQLHGGVKLSLRPCIFQLSLSALQGGGSADEMRCDETGGLPRQNWGGSGKGARWDSVIATGDAWMRDATR